MSLEDLIKQMARHVADGNDKAVVDPREVLQALLAKPAPVQISIRGAYDAH